jgi:hypothetical protein
MSPQTLIATLDAYLAESGEDIVLQRSGVPCQCRAAVRQKDRPDQLVSGNEMDDLYAIMSMTQIQAAGWNAGTVDTGLYARDRAIPRRGDFAVVKGIRYRVDAADVIAVQNVVVRVNLNLKGNTSGA